MKEKDLYTKLSKIVKDKFLKTPAGFELKIVHKNKPFYTRQLPEDQERALRMCSLNGVYFKIPDEGFSNKPFDAFLLYGKGYLVIFFESSKRFYFIDVNDYIAFKGDKHKLEEDQCESISTLVY